MKAKTRFDICKNYFFILPSIQIITSKIHPHPADFIFGVDVDWLCFHFSISLVKEK